LAASAAVCIAMLSSAPAGAGVSVGIGINLGPPAERVEVVPVRPHPGWVWVKGHWRRFHGQWVWVDGHWGNPPRMNAAWMPGHYNRRGDWVEGHWRY
jgi:hypothetical protein